MTPCRPSSPAKQAEAEAGQEASRVVVGLQVDTRGRDLHAALVTIGAAMGGVRIAELTAELRQRIASIPVMATLDPKALAEGLERCRLLDIGSGVPVFKQGEYGDELYILVAGGCEATRESADQGGDIIGLISASNGIAGDGYANPEAFGNAVTSVRVTPVRPGDVFGVMACMSSWPRSGSVITTMPSLLLEVGSEVFQDWMHGSETFSTRMTDDYMSRGLRTLLRGHDAFAGLGADAIRELQEGATVHRFERGQSIVREHEPGDAFYILRGGVVAVSRRLADKDRTISYLRAGAYFGEMALVDGATRKATVTATGRTEVIAIDRERFLSVLDRHPEATDLLRRRIRERLQAGEAALWNDNLSDALGFMAGQGILSGTEVLVVDLERCTHCGYCDEACAENHDVALISLHGPTFGRHLFPTACRHCEDPLCLQHCPVNAIVRDVSGEVKFHEHCTGCGGCAVSCPYGTISMARLTDDEVDHRQRQGGLKKPVTRRALKCDLCADVPSGPQCVANCPTAAVLLFDTAHLVQHVLSLPP